MCNEEIFGVDIEIFGVDIYRCVMKRYLVFDTKTIIYDYFIPGYDCAIVNYIDRYLY